MPHRSSIATGLCPFGRVLLLTLLLCCFNARAADFALRPNDVVVFVGGANTVAAQESGHLEALLTLAFPQANVRYRSLAWEADTVFVQSRDLNFPPLIDQVKRVGGTVVVFQFGQSESLQGQANLSAFKDAYRKMVHELTLNGERRGLLITPPPFESAGKDLPDLTSRNTDLKAYVAAIRELGAEEKIPVVDLFTRLSEVAKPSARLTSDGLHLTPAGQAAVAGAVVQELALDRRLPPTGVSQANGKWNDPNVEKLRQAITAKNRLWFDYYRPMNWAFLAGDRTEQPSSRSHLKYSHRWFPEEMENFLPLIAQAESNITQLAQPATTP
jgi:lysophospholipase L1-like esterase